MVTIDEFKKLNLLIAQVLAAHVHPNADKLYVLTVDTGSDKRQIVAGIRQQYQPEQLIGRQIVLVENLAPAIIRGVESHGMLLAASDGKTLTILQPDQAIATGSRVS